MSLGWESNHSPNPAATASNPAVLVRSAPVAVTRATARVIAVSSVHSPGAQSNGPPPIIPMGRSGPG